MLRVEPTSELVGSHDRKHRQEKGVNFKGCHEVRRDKYSGLLKSTLNGLLKQPFMPLADVTNKILPRGPGASAPTKGKDGLPDSKGEEMATDNTTPEKYTKYKKYMRFQGSQATVSYQYLQGFACPMPNTIVTASPRSQVCPQKMRHECGGCYVAEPP